MVQVCEKHWSGIDHSIQSQQIRYGFRAAGGRRSQGFGNATAAYRYAWSGVGWYYRNLSIPASWCASSQTLAVTSDGDTRRSSSVVLTIGGVMRRGRAWLDGVEVGPEHVGYVDEM